MVFRQISTGLQEKAVSELNEDPTRIEEHLEHIREWLKKQPHLTIRSDDQSILTFLRGCKWSLQRTKEKIDYFYTIRTLIPDLLLNRDPLNEDMQRFLRRGVFYPLPKPLGADGSRICFFDYSRLIFETMPATLLFKYFYMSLDVLLWEDDDLIISGLVIIVNGESFPLNYLLQFTPSLLKKVTLCIQRVYPVRVQRCVVINANEGLETIYNMCKPFISKKLTKRIHLFTSEDTEEAYKIIPKCFFPEEFGGNNGLCSKASEEWVVKMEGKREWFIEDAKYTSVETLRPGKPKSYTEELDMEGSFRKLNVD